MKTSNRVDLDLLRNGLDGLKSSELYSCPEFTQLYNAMTKHVNAASLVHLVTRDKTTLENAKTDTKFYDILVQMLLEVSQSVSGYKPNGLRLVYGWYLQNRHILSTKPKFEWSKIEEKLSQSGVQPSPDLHINIASQEMQSPRTIHHSSTPRQMPPPTPQSDRQPQLQKQPQTHQTNLKDENCNDVKHVVLSDADRAVLSEANRAVLSDDVTKRDLIPRDTSKHKQMPQSYASQCRPYSMVKYQEDSSKQERYNRQLMRSAKRNCKAATVQEKWREYRQNVGIGQDQIAIKSLVGRSGQLMDIRNVEYPEYVTQKVIDAYRNMPGTGDSCKGDQVLNTSTKLEDFYDHVEAMHDEQRKLTKRRLGHQLKQHKKQDSEVVPADDSMHLNNLLNMVDRVSGDMAYYKEKLVPRPYPGYRIPSGKVPKPAIRRRRTPSPQLNDKASEDEVVIWQTQPNYSVDDCVQNCADWRGNVVPEPHEEKKPCGQKLLKRHTYLKKQRLFRCPPYRKAHSLTIDDRTLSHETRVKTPIKDHTDHIPKHQVPSRPPTAAESHGTQNIEDAMTVTQLFDVPSECDEDYFDEELLARLAQYSDEFVQLTANRPTEYLSFVTPIISLFPKKAQERVQDKQLKKEFEKDLQQVLMTGQISCHELMGIIEDVKSAVTSHDNFVDIDDAVKAISSSRMIIEAPSDGMISGKPPMPKSRASMVAFSQDVECVSPADSLLGSEATLGKTPSRGLTPYTTDEDDPRSITRADTFIQEGRESTDTGRVSKDTGHYTMNTDEFNDTYTTQSREISDMDDIGDGIDGESRGALTRFTDYDDGQCDREFDLYTGGMFMPPQQTYDGCDQWDGTNQGDGISDTSKSIRFTIPPVPKLNMKQLLSTVESNNRYKRPKMKSYAEFVVSARSKSSQSKFDQNRPKPSILDCQLTAESRPVSDALDVGIRVMQLSKHHLRTPASGYPRQTIPSIPGVQRRAPGETAMVPYPNVTSSFMGELDHYVRNAEIPKDLLDKVSHLRVEERPGGVAVVRESCSEYLDDLLQINSLASSRRRPTSAEPTSESAEQKVVSKSPPATPKRFPQSPQTSRPGSAKGSSSRTSNQSAQSRASTIDSGRPIPTYHLVADPDQVAEASRVYKEAKAATDIQKIFRGFVARKKYLLLSREFRVRKETEQIARNRSDGIYREHRKDLEAIYARPIPSPATTLWQQQLDQTQKTLHQDRSGKVQLKQQQITKNTQEATKKIRRIGPHVDIYEYFNPGFQGYGQAMLNRAATVIQKYVRGWLIRKDFADLRRQLSVMGMSFYKTIREYKDVVRKVQIQHGRIRTNCPFHIPDVSAFIENRRKYQAYFDRISCGGEIEEKYLQNFFKECGLFPSRAEIGEALDVLLHGIHIKQKRGLSKAEVMDILFYIYTPKAAGIQERKSTWMNPIVDGEEAAKLLDTVDLSSADFVTCAKLVMKSIRERKGIEVKRRWKSVLPMAKAFKLQQRMVPTVRKPQTPKKPVEPRIVTSHLPTKGSTVAKLKREERNPPAAVTGTPAPMTGTPAPVTGKPKK